MLTDEVKAFLGREVSFTAPEELGRAAIRYFARAIGDDNPVYTSDDAARAAGLPGVVAPPTLVCETNQFIDGPRDDDGYIGHTWALPVLGARLIRGGNEYSFERPVRPDDRITATYRVAEMTERTSSAGQSMLIVINEITYTDQHGDLLATNRETMLYREQDPS